MWVENDRDRDQLGDDDHVDFVDDDGYDYNFDLGNVDDDVGMNMHMNGDDDPFLYGDVHGEPPNSPTPSPPKQPRKKITLSSSSDSDVRLRIKKSPRKSKEHTSLMRQSSERPDHQRERELDPDLEDGDAVRPASPSPLRPRPKAPSTKPTSKKLVLKTIAKRPNDSVIDISSEEDIAPPPRQMKPLLVARSRKTQSHKDTIKVTKPIGKVVAKSALTTTYMNSRPIYDDADDDDVIDLT